MQNVIVTISQRLPPRVQRKVWDAWQYVAVSGSLQAASEKVMCESVKLKMQWRFKEVRVAKNVLSAKESCSQ
jgi:hypothetical protein